MTDQDPDCPSGCPESFHEHMIADLHEVARMVAAMHKEFERARPLLRMLSPGNGMTDLQRAGLARAVRKVRRGTPPGSGDTS